MHRHRRLRQIGVAHGDGLGAPAAADSASRLQQRQRLPQVAPPDAQSFGQSTLGQQATFGDHVAPWRAPDQC